MIKIKSLFISFSFLFASTSYGLGCPQFETVLEQALARVAKREAVKTTESTIALSKVEVVGYKNRYGNEATLPPNSNRNFMDSIEKDTKAGFQDVLYFDVENAVQKKLNDSVFGEKTMVDAVNNSFMTKFRSNIAENPELMSRLEGEYKDYKSLRLRLHLKPGDDPVKYEKMLNELYQKTNKEFTQEFEALKLTKQISPRTDEVPDVSRWFLAGSGETPLEANMAARGASGLGIKGEATLLNFRDHIAEMDKNVRDIEAIRQSLTRNSQLLKAGLLERTAEGLVIPSKEMVGILRKIKPSDCTTPAEYASKIRAKVKTLFGSEISDETIHDFTMHFQKVDSISPPLFSRERTIINLAEANNGIVSVDFAGVGVDNAYEQMRGLAAVNYAQTDKAKMLTDAFTRVQTQVDSVTTSMNETKRAFSSSVRDVHGAEIKPQFSGDDGILMPKAEWGLKEKSQLIKQLGESADPSKYRVTFVRSEYASGKLIPVAERSKRIVRAESLEKTIREAVTGIRKVESSEAKKLIVAIDYVPSKKGGKFNILLGGRKPTAAEKELVSEALKKSLNSGQNEVVGELIDTSDGN